MRNQSIDNFITIIPLFYNNEILKNIHMKKITLFMVLSLFCIGVFSQSKMKSYTFPIIAKSNSSLKGNVAIQVNKKNEVVLNVQAEGIAPGKHGVHIHAKGDCSSDDAMSAGGHWNPNNKQHGLCEKGGCANAHAGDMGNLLADTNGKVNFTFSTSDWCINCSDTTKNINHKALIIHDQNDDLSSQPAGNAGKRIGCVVLNFDK